MTRRLLWTIPAALLLVTALAVACGGDDGKDSGDAQAPAWPDVGAPSGDVVPILVNSQLALGDNRFLIALMDAENNLLAAPDLPVRLAFYNLAQSREEPVAEADGQFVWAIPDERGLYVAPVSFDATGRWGVDVTATPPGGAPLRARAVFTVLDDTTTPSPGDPAPASDTKTLADVGGDFTILTSDDEPDERLYQLSIADAIADGKPFVVSFVSPAFCSSQVCGPTLDAVKALMPDYIDRVNFIHVEVYDLSKRPDLVTADAVGEWGLPSEPWIFVVDTKGMVSAAFEGSLAPEELRDALDAALAGADAG